MLQGSEEFRINFDMPGMREAWLCGELGARSCCFFKVLWHQVSISTYLFCQGGSCWKAGVCTESAEELGGAVPDCEHSE